MSRKYDDKVFKNLQNKQIAIIYLGQSSFYRHCCLQTFKYIFLNWQTF